VINKLEYQNIEQLLSVNIIKTKSNLKIAVAWFTSPNLFAIVMQLLERDVVVELILCNEEINFINPKINYDQFIAANGKLYVGNPSHLMHNKFCVIDDRYLINGSYNWTLKAEKSNYENVVLTDNLNLVNDFKGYFEYLKTNTDAVAKVNLLKTNSTISESEKQAELELISKVEIIKIPTFVSKTDAEPSEEVIEAIEKAVLLYNNMKQEECIAYCKLMIERYEDIPAFYYWTALAYWRLNNPKELIEYAQKAVDLDNQLYDAYNLLGIGYGQLGKEQLSRSNYDNCIRNEPDTYDYYRNRSIILSQLQVVPNIPQSNLLSYRKQKIADLEKILEIIDKSDKDDLSYNELDCKSFANFYLGNIRQAKDDIALALEKYNLVEDRLLKDKNILIEMKDLQKQISNHKK
jgi:tetratricopeptide (TPR) repeat protein